jgi:hypothetical protein
VDQSWDIDGGLLPDHLNDDTAPEHIADDEPQPAGDSPSELRLQKCEKNFYNEKVGSKHASYH